MENSASPISGFSPYPPMPKMTAPETSLQPVWIVGLGLMGQGI